MIRALPDPMCHETEQYIHGVFRSHFCRRWLQRVQVRRSFGIADHVRSAFYKYSSKAMYDPVVQGAGVRAFSAICELCTRVLGRCSRSGCAGAGPPLTVPHDVRSYKKTMYECDSHSALVSAIDVTMTQRRALGFALGTLSFVKLRSAVYAVTLFVMLVAYTLTGSMMLAVDRRHVR